MNDEPIPLEDEIYEEEIEVEEETSVMMAMWGEIIGDIDNQTDLKEALDAKQDNLTQAQLDAVNSGINSTKVETYDGYQAQINTKASQSALDAEAEARRQADSTLQGNIDAEETARKASDKDIQDVLDGETLARQNADTALGGRIDTEIHDRQVADIGLQGQIDAITSKSDVVDVVATYADLQAYDTQHLGDNDVIKVLDDETHGDALTYYRWSKTNQTWTFIGQEAPYYSKSQTDALLLGKQNTIDSSHKLSADLVDDTSTTNKFVTASDITNWNGKQDALTAGTGIDITGGVISTPAIVPEVVAELPTTGAEGKLYLTPKAHTTSTATGNPIEATVTEQAGQLESLKLDGDTYQQTYTGKNLFDYQNANVRAGYILNDSGVEVSDSTGGYTRQFSKVTPNTSYILSPLIGAGTRRVYYFDSNKSFISRSDGYMSKTSMGFTTPANCYYVDFQLYTRDNLDQDDMHNWQLEAGSTATSYEPYVGGQPSPNPSYPQDINVVTGTQTISINGTNYPLDLGDIELCKIEGKDQPLVFDYIYKDGENWKIHKTIAKQTIIGSKVGLNSNYANVQFATVPKPSDSRLYGNYTAIFIYNDHAIYRYNSGGWNNSDLDHGVFTTPNLENYWFGYPKGTSLETMQSELNGAITYYALATPTDATITDQTLIAQLEAVRTASLATGTSTITNNATGTNLAGDMEIGYFGFNPTNRYDKFIWLNLNNNYEQIGGE